jgi:enamine deaminase RidA (YjgF/YER057c/UK114 family)
VAGQIPADASGNLIEGSIAEKTAQCCANIKAILEAAGSSMDRVARVGVRVSTPLLLPGHERLFADLNVPAGLPD